LPPPRWTGCRGLIRREPTMVKIDQTPVVGSLQHLGILEFHQIRRTREEQLFNSLIAKHHYLGYVQPVGEHLKYLVYGSGRRPLACLAWSSAARHLAPRDRFIGWTPDARSRNIRFIAYNTRYLILPWVQIPHLASHILGRMRILVPRDWDQIYGHSILYFETFIDRQRFAGTCYRAANWIVLGWTTGRGKASNTRAPNRSLKLVLGYPLDRQFRRLLATV
jgi:hypothetical protein